MATETPLVSVVIPVYNGSNYLREAIDSALNQTYPNIEILVIDDGSTDDTWEIIQSYGHKIRGIHKKNGGVSSALNLGIQNMRGEWFAWLSHDDLWLQENIERKIRFILENPGGGVYYGGYSYINPKHEILYGNNGCWYPSGENLRRMLRSGNYIHGITALVHRECFERVGMFNEGLRCTQDYEMWFRIATEYATYLLPQRLAQTRIHPEQIGNVSRNHCALEFDNTRKNLLTMVSKDDLFPTKNKGIAKLYCNVYTKYLSFCVRWNIPSLRDGLFSFSKKILPKSFICNIVRMMDKGE